MKRIAVYCGASKGIHPVYQDHAARLADWIVDHNYELVYGGGKVGLMGVVANRVLGRGGKVIGIMPQFLIDREIAHDRLNQLIVTADMDERKQKMMEMADCCIALPGGPGTLEEIAEAVSWTRVGENNSPCVFFNVNGYYDLIAAFFDQMVREGFLSAADRAKVLISDSLTEVDAWIAAYAPPEIRRYTT